MRAVRRKIFIFLVSLLAMLAIVVPFKHTTAVESQIMKPTVTNIEAATVAQAVIWEE